MSEVLTKVVDSDQAAFIKGRNIEDSICLIEDIMTSHTHKKNK